MFKEQILMIIWKFVCSSPFDDFSQTLSSNHSQTQRPKFSSLVPKIWKTLKNSFFDAQRSEEAHIVHHFKNAFMSLRSICHIISNLFGKSALILISLILDKSC